MATLMFNGKNLDLAGVDVRVNFHPKTPEQIAAETVNDNTAPDEWSPILMGDIRGLIATAIEADRAQMAAKHIHMDGTPCYTQHNNP